MNHVLLHDFFILPGLILKYILHLFLVVLQHRIPLVIHHLELLILRLNILHNLIILLN